MIDWIKDYASKYGAHGLAMLAIALLSLLALENSHILPSAHEDALAAAGDAAKAVNEATRQMNEHIEQTKSQNAILIEIKNQLQQNHLTQQKGAILLCLRMSKTAVERDKCADIQ